MDPRLGGYTVSDWFTIFTDTHYSNGMGGFTRVEWPDGEPYMEQPAIVPVALGLVMESLVSEIKRNHGSI